MAIGLAYGRAEFESGRISRGQPASLEALTRARWFCERFREKFGSLRCADVEASIRGADYKKYTTYDTIEAFEDHAKCGDVTGPAARFAAEIMLQPTELFAPEMKVLVNEIKQVRNLQKSHITSK